MTSRRSALLTVILGIALGIVIILLVTKAFGAPQSVSIDTATHKIINPIVKFGSGNTLDGTGATITGFPGSSYSFAQSLLNTAGTVTLLNDSATPGNSKYYGTDSGGTRGYFNLPTSGSGTFIDLDFTGNNLTFMNGTTMWKSTGDSTDVTTLTYLNAGLVFKDVNGLELFRLWETSGTDWSLFLGAAAGENFVPVIGAGGALTAIGHHALNSITTGTDNTAVGAFAGDQNLFTGEKNVFVGMDSKTFEDVSNSTVVGYNASTYGEQSVVIGAEASAGFITQGNSIAIGYGANAINANTAYIGNNQITDLFAGEGNAILHAPNVLPAGGVTGARLIKASGTNYDAVWATPTSTPTATPSSTATATATPTPTPSATATAFPQGFTAHFSRGGAALQANDVTLTPWTSKYPGTITGFIISADQGTCTLKVWKKATGTAIPTIADVINTSGVSLATGTHIDSTTVTDFTTTTVSVGDQFMAQVTAVSGGTTDITFQIPIRQ